MIRLVKLWGDYEDRLSKINSRFRLKKISM